MHGLWRFGEIEVEREASSPDYDPAAQAHDANERLGRHGCLSGYVVLDLTHVLSGPLVTSILGCLGATIIKVEPVSGDINRRQPPFATTDGVQWDQVDSGAIGLSFLKRNVTKLGICLDLKTPAGMAVLLRLARVADAFVHNFRPGVAERLGVAEHQMQVINPRLVYCAVEGLGPYAQPGDDRGVVDLVAQALSGLMAATGQPDGPPTRCVAPIGDCVAGLYGAIAVLAGLLERDGRRATKLGRNFKVSMLGSLVSVLWDEHLDVNHRAGLPARSGNSISRNCPFNAYETSDNEWVVISAFSASEWRRLVEATEMAELDRPEFEQQLERVRHRNLIEEHLSRWVGARPRADVVARLARSGVTFAPVTTIADVLADEHYQKSLLYGVRHPIYGRTGALGAAFPIVAGDQQVHPDPAPALGQHTDAVLRDIARMSSAEIASLKASGVAR